MAGAVNLDLHVIVFQLHEVAPHIHLFPEGANQLFSQLVHLLPLKGVAMELYFSCDTQRVGEKNCLRDAIRPMNTLREKKP